MLPLLSRRRRRSAAPLLVSSASALVLAACGGGGSGSSESPTGPPLDPPVPVVDLADGAPRDVAASDDSVWLAQGRRVSTLDAVTLVRLDHLERTYDENVAAVDHDPVTGALWVATDGAVHRYDPPDSLVPTTWVVPDEDGDGERDLSVQDVRPLPGAAAVLAEDRLLVLDASGPELVPQGWAPTPEAFVLAKRLVVYRSVTGAWRAAIKGTTLIHERDVHGIAFAELDHAGGWQDVAVGEPWIPDLTLHPFSTAHYVQVVADEATGRDLAFVAARQGGIGEAAFPYVPILDVTDPLGEHPVVGTLDVGGGSPKDVLALHCKLDTDESHLLVLTRTALHKVELATQETVGVLSYQVLENDNDLAVARYPLGERLWLFQHSQIDYPLVAFDVSGEVPAVLDEGWWWVGCDAAVAVPEWGSLYLCIWGGVLRYDVTDPAAPFVPGGIFAGAGAHAYQPASAVTEDGALHRAGERSFLVAARGEGGFDAFEVSAEAPDPAPPVTLASELENFSYNNAVESWTHPGSGETYVLTDATTSFQGDRTFYLEAARWSEEEGAFAWVARSTGVKPAKEVFQPLSSNVTTYGRWALVGCRGLLFVCDLLALPDALPVVEVVHFVDAFGTGWVKGIETDGEHLYLGLRTPGPKPGQLRVLPFDAATGQVDEVPVATLGYGSPGVPSDFEVAGRVRLHPDGSRLYACGTKGRLYEIEVATPSAPKLLSTFTAAGEGNTSDCPVVDFPFPDGSVRTLVVFVTVSESFKLLDPDE